MPFWNMLHLCRIKQWYQVRSSIVISGFYITLPLLAFPFVTPCPTHREASWAAKGFSSTMHA